MQTKKGSIITQDSRGHARRKITMCTRTHLHVNSPPPISSGIIELITAHQYRPTLRQLQIWSHPQARVPPSTNRQPNHTKANTESKRHRVLTLMRMLLVMALMVVAMVVAVLVMVIGVRGDGGL